MKKNFPVGLKKKKKDFQKPLMEYSPLSFYVSLKKKKR